MRIRFFGVLAGLSMIAPAQAQQTGPARLVMVVEREPIVLDYPSAARCTAALREIREENARREAAANARRQDNPQAVVLPQFITAFCIPG
jgi:hypothetical protein